MGSGSGDFPEGDPSGLSSGADFPAQIRKPRREGQDADVGSAGVSCPER